jgi:lipopolysaccharide/colanic/teichoic acid biosynthesis glycosyltransferase
MSQVQNRVELVEELYRRYESSSQRNKLWNHSKYLSKRYSWAIIVGGTKLLKRATDIVVSVGMLLSLSPLLVGAALAVKFIDGGPVLFWQMRVGQWGREFPFPKFRSMVVSAEHLKDTLLTLNDHGSGVTFKMKRDPRVTRIGRIMRKFSVDELPQLWCVLRGDMSLVGPRPPVPREVAQYTLLDRRRLDAKPGLTCIWQVSGRSDVPFDRQVELDVQYIESQTLLLDFLLLLKTVPAILIGKGAY